MSTFCPQASPCVVSLYSLGFSTSGVLAAAQAKNGGRSTSLRTAGSMSVGYLTQEPSTSTPFNFTLSLHLSSAQVSQSPTQPSG